MSLERVHVRVFSAGPRGQSAIKSSLPPFFFFTSFFFFSFWHIITMSVDCFDHSDED